MQEFEGIAIRKIDNVPYVLGAEAIRAAFERFGIKKSKKAVYKFLSKTTWKRRVKENGKSMIAVPIYEIKRWIEKNYPMIKEMNEEKSYISKNFGIIDGFQKVIDDLTAKIEDPDSVPEIFKNQQEGEDENSKSSVIDQVKTKASKEEQKPNERLLELSQEFIKMLMKHPPATYDSKTLEKLKEDIAFIYSYIENILKLKKISGEST